MNLQKDTLYETVFFKKPNTKIISRRRQTINSNLNIKNMLEEIQVSHLPLFFVAGLHGVVLITVRHEFEILIIFSPTP